MKDIANDMKILLVFRDSKNLLKAAFTESSSLAAARAANSADTEAVVTGGNPGGRIPAAAICAATLAGGIPPRNPGGSPGSPAAAKAAAAFAPAPAWRPAWRKPGGNPAAIDEGNPAPAACSCISLDKSGRCCCCKYENKEMI